MRPNWQRTARRSSDASFPINLMRTPDGDGRCSLALTVSMTTPGRTLQLGWSPHDDFRRFLDHLKSDEDPRSPLARTMGAKVPSTVR